jgi:hypothetical protein
MPSSSVIQTLQFERLVDRFRTYEIDSDEFGFTARIVGLAGKHYNEQSALLGNHGIFSEYAAMWKQGKLSESEYSAIQRYQFHGKNCILREHTWIDLLNRAKLKFIKTQLTGKLWYSFYPLYHCSWTD